MLQELGSKDLSLSLTQADHHEKSWRPNVTVHHYTAQRSHFESASYNVLPSSTPTSTQLIIQGRKLVELCATRAPRQNWVNAELRNVRKVQGENSANLFQYRFPAPPAPIALSVLSAALKEWGSVVTDDEIWSIAELEEFVHAQVVQEADHSSSKVTVLDPQEPVTPAKRPIDLHSVDPSTEIPSPKRRKLDLGSIYELIPQPHIHPTPVLETPTRGLPAYDREYKRTVPILLPPYTDPLPPPSRYDRRAWVIPLRGELPWDNTTPAYLLDAIPQPIPPAPRSLEPIFWSRPAIQALWKFLLNLQKSGRVGAIGVSLLVARPGLRSTTQSIHESSGVSVKSASQAPSVAHRLALVDYVKLYHEAPKSMLVRNALDVWKYAYEPSDGVPVEKIRLLKGAKLVLMDNLSRGMMVS